MNDDKWIRIKKQLGIVRQIVIDNSGVHAGTKHGDKIRVNGPRIARGKKAKNVNPSKKTNHERVSAGRYQFLKRFGAKAYLAKFD